MSIQPRQNRKGGPQTPSGKSIAARNSTKLGVYTQQVILPGENPEEFSELLGLFIEDFQPRGVTEAALVHDLAVLAWKKRRLEGIEHRQLMLHLQSAPSEYEFSLAGLTMVKGMEEFILDPYHIDDCDIQTYREYNVQMRLLRKGEKDEAALLALKSQSPESFHFLVAKMKEIGLKNVTPLSMVEAKYTGASSNTKATPLDDAINMALGEAHKIVWAADNKAAIIEAHNRIRDARLASKIDNQRFDRANEHLDRSFYKTLSELRKQQEWRRKMQVIDVTILAAPNNA